MRLRKVPAHQSGELPEVANFVVAGKQRLMPFFNRSNNEDIILVIQSAEVSRGRNGFFLRYAAKALHDNRKDKSGEPLARCILIAAKARRIEVIDEAACKARTPARTPHRRLRRFRYSLHRLREIPLSRQL